MEKLELENGRTILSWAPISSIEESAVQQLKNVASHPCITKPVVVCPDVHAGYGVTIGSVLAVDNALIPNAVGVDIGCSMSACKTNIEADSVSRETLEKVINKVRERIPVGFSHQKEKQSHYIFNDELWKECPICKENYESAQYQLGTMGGGNHFIELQKGDDGFLYYMIHSGSRNLGYQVGNAYNKAANNLCKTWRHFDVVENELAFLPEGVAEYYAYEKEMNLCLKFASANHEVMRYHVEASLQEITSDIIYEKKWYTRHNYATMEHHHGRDFMVHRKGAIMAREGVEQIIPGSQGTASYIVRGLGNPASYCSASHGSGRIMSRKKAQETLNLSTEQEKMKNIIHNMNTLKQLDEAPSAYKNIEDVLEQEKDLVTPIVKLTPLAVVKG